MPQIIIYTDVHQNTKVERLAKKWKLSKVDTIRKIIDEYEESQNH